MVDNTNQIAELIRKSAEISAELFRLRFVAAMRYMRTSPTAATKRAHALCELIRDQLERSPKNWPYLGQLLDDLLAELQIL